MKLSGWGNFPISHCKAIELKALKNRETTNYIARGMGRSYGDSALAPTVVSMLEESRFLDFDDETGVLRAEAGVTLADVIRVFAPRGWFPSVCPGTKYVTLGGMVACDVHGKNHHMHGSFGNFVLEFDLQLSDGRTITCSGSQNSEIFNATIGGMGLTGVIQTVTFMLRRIETRQITQQIIPAANLCELMNSFEESSESTYSVAWIDCLAKGKSLGRSVLFLGEHTELSEFDSASRGHALGHQEKRRLTLPFFMPNFFLNFIVVKAFNVMYFHLHKRKAGGNRIDADKFFFPLDRIKKWNKMYGRKGFVQYQFCVPKEKSKEVLEKVLERIAESKSGSFLAVLKLFGRGRGWMSFPQRGYTLALDFPVTNPNLSLLDELDDIVHEGGGRLYLAKDARLAPKHLELGYPDLEDFVSVKKTVDPENKIRSAQWARLRPGEKIHE